MSNEKAGGPPAQTKAGPQGTQTLSRDQLDDVLENAGPKTVELPRAHRATLIRIDVDGAPTFELSADRMTIGRSSTCDLCIEEPSISSEHARLIRDENGWRIVNLLSTNGIFVNGKKVFSAPLHDRDEIRLGRVRLRFMDPNSGARPRDGGKWKWAVAALIAAGAAIAALLLTGF